MKARINTIFSNRLLKICKTKIKKKKICETDKDNSQCDKSSQKQAFPCMQVSVYICANILKVILAMHLKDLQNACYLTQYFHS